jgi:hypothetical protein
MSKISINPIKATWKSIEKIEFEVIYENSRNCNFLTLTIRRIFELNDLEVGQFLLQLIENGNNKYKVSIQIQNIGVYYISSVTAEQYPLHKTIPNRFDMHHPMLFDPFDSDEFFSPYFIVTNDDSNYSSKAIKEYATNIIEERKEKILLGEQNKIDNQEYEAIVFCKDVYLSKSINFKTCKILPFEPTSNENVLSQINKYLQPKWNKFEKKDIRVDILYYPNPQTILSFPNVYANNHDEAIDLIMLETETILSTYSITRNSFGEVLGVALRDKKTLDQYLTISQMDYVGNIACGDIFGENPFLNNAIADTLRQNGFLQLCISLYNQAMHESNIEFAFAKYWSVLEMLSESKQYNDKRLHKIDLDGNKFKHSNSTQFRPGKKDYVRELIRDFKEQNKFIDDTFSKAIPELNGKMEDLLTIWYNHRNCAVHDGGCNKNVLPKCKELCSITTKKYIQKQKGIEVHQNRLLNTIGQTIRQILFVETTKDANDKNLVNDSMLQEISVVRKRQYLTTKN